MLTEEQVKTLKSFEQHFTNARAGFCRGVYKEDVDTLRPIYESLGFKLSNPRCGECILTMIKVVGTEYEIYKDKYGKSKKESNRNSTSKRTKARGKNDDHQQRADKDEIKKTNN